MELVKTHRETAPVIGPPTIQDALDAFIANQDVMPNSRKVYRQNLKQFFTWVDLKDYDIKSLTRVQLIEYKEELLQAGKSSLTVSSYISSVRRFYEWAEANRFSPNIAKGVKSPRKQQQFKKQPLGLDQVKTLLNAAKTTPGGDLKAVRNYAILNLMVMTALRTIEVVRANVEDIGYMQGTRVLHIHGKGRVEKDRFVILDDDAYFPILDYLNKRGDKTGPLFTSTSNNNRGKRLTTKTISELSKQTFRRIGIDTPEYTAHSLRHTAIVNARRGGATAERTQGMAGHAGPGTTQLYDEFFRTEERIKNPAEKFLADYYRAIR
jgi:integrase/recombinase XerD